MATETEWAWQSLGNAVHQLGGAEQNCGYGAEDAERQAAVAAQQGWEAIAAGMLDVANQFREGHEVFGPLKEAIGEAQALLLGNREEDATKPIQVRLAEADSAVGQVIGGVSAARSLFVAVANRIGGLLEHCSDSTAWQCAQEIAEDDTVTAIAHLSDAKERISGQVQAAGNLGRN